jgi:hypothetical protein
MFTVTCNVRNELNYRRALHDPKEVVTTVHFPDLVRGPAYMPRVFPRGVWNITGIERTNDPTFAPVKIKTDAHQLVNLWALDSKGGYDHKLDATADDGGYWLHYSANSSTTLGCGRIVSSGSANALAALIEPLLGKEIVCVEVL